MHGRKLVRVPIPIGVKVCMDQFPKTREEEEDMSHVPYVSALGILMYEMVYTKPYIVLSLCKFIWLRKKITAVTRNKLEDGS
jgi:hypothetical protein